MAIGDYVDKAEETTTERSVEGLAGDVDLEGIEDFEEEAEKGFNILAKSLDKNLSEYSNHPFVEGLDAIVDNRKAEEGIKQMLRGIEGVTGKETQLALMDILAGAIKSFKSINPNPEGE